MVTTQHIDDLDVFRSDIIQIEWGFCCFILEMSGPAGLRCCYVGKQAPDLANWLLSAAL
jgi:hypothetical protein